MISLLIISDDFTGALDTGIQFAQHGAKTKIITATENLDFLWIKNGVEVLVIDAETRHLSVEQAYQRVYTLTKNAMTAGVTHIYKKTDSGLRGNIGSELKALLDASGENFLPFIPAYPQMNRITIKGCHYIDGQPIRESVFGKDPFEPVVISEVRELFDHDTKIELFGKDSEYNTDFDTPAIGIFDAQCDNDIRSIANSLYHRNQLRIMAGCAGFASILPKLLKFRKRKINIPKLQHTLLVMCGSVNPISVAQMEYAQKEGFKRIILNPRQQLEQGYLSSQEGMIWLQELESFFQKYQVVMLDTGISDLNMVDSYINENYLDLNKARARIALALGEIMKKLLEINDKHTLMIIGGDTLLGFFTAMKINEIYPVAEIEAGTVLSYMKHKRNKIWIITKSGGFGKQDIIGQIAKKLILEEEAIYR